MATKAQTIRRLQAVQRDIAKQPDRIAERNRLLVELHQEHRVRQADLADLVNAVGGDRTLSVSGVGAAITRTLGHRAGRVTNLAARRE